MRKPATIAITLALIALGVITGRFTASAHPGHTISVNDATATEGGAATFTLTVTPAPEAGETVSVKVATANGSALGVTSCPSGSGSPSSDYARVPSTTVTFAAGEGTKQQAVSTCQDASGEANETFFLNLSDATQTCAAPCTTSSVSISRFQGVGTINDDEDTPALTIDDRIAAEGAVGSTSFVFPVRLSSPTSKTVTVTAATRNGTAGANDYTSRNATLTFPANTTAPQNLTVSVTGDTASETDETFFVDLSNASNARISDPEGIGIIQNDDAPASGANTFGITDVTRNEGNTLGAPATPFTFTVTLGRAPGAGHTATVNYHAGEGTASSGSDYNFVSGTLTFDSNETAETVTVAVIGDTTPESSETFSVILSNAGCSTVATPCDAPSIADAEGKGTITNDDNAGPTPTPSPGPSVTPTVRVGGYFQARVTAASPCQAARLIKVKKVVPGTDRVMVDGITNADGVYKEAVRPKKKGQFYAQVYTFTKDGVTCRGGKSPVRTLPA